METASIRASGPEVGGSQRNRRTLSRRARNSLLTAHIALSVGLLGDSAGSLAVAIRASTVDDDPLRAREAAETLTMFGFVFGIPLSVAAIVTGIALGLGTRWGVVRYPWVVAKLLIVVSVMVVGGVMLGPASDQLLDGDTSATARLIAGATYDVIALAVATALGVFKPGRPFGRDRPN